MAKEYQSAMAEGIMPDELNKLTPAQLHWINYKPQTTASYKEAVARAREAAAKKKDHLPT